MLYAPESPTKVFQNPVIMGGLSLVVASRTQRNFVKSELTVAWFI